MPAAGEEEEKQPPPFGRRVRRAEGPSRRSQRGWGEAKGGLVCGWVRGPALRAVLLVLDPSWGIERPERGPSVSAVGNR